MTHVRRGFLLAFVLVAPFALFATGAEESQGAATDVKLAYWVGGYAADAIQELNRQAGEFQRKTGIAVEITSWPWTDFYAKLHNAIDLNKAPDVWEVGFAQTWAQRKAVIPLTKRYNSLPYANSFLPAFKTGAERDGEIWGIPRILTVWQIMVNRDMFKEAGLDPDAPIASWDQLLQISKKLTVDKNGDGRIDQYGWGLHGGNLSSHYFQILMYQLGAKVTTEAGDLLIQNYEKEAVQVLEFMLEQSKYSPGGAKAAAAYDYAALLRLFAGKEIAMMDTTAGNRRAVVEMSPDLADSISFANLPTNKGIPGRTGDSMAGGGWIYISSSSSHPDEAWRFIEFLQEPENAIKALTLANFIPQRLDLTTNPLLASNPIGVMMRQASQGAQLQAQHPAWTEMRKKVMDAISEVLLGVKTPQNAAHDMIQAIVAMDKTTN